MYAVIYFLFLHDSMPIMAIIKALYNIIFTSYSLIIY